MDEYLHQFGSFEATEKAIQIAAAAKAKHEEEMRQHDEWQAKRARQYERVISNLLYKYPSLTQSDIEDIYYWLKDYSDHAYDEVYNP